MVDSTVMQSGRYKAYPEYKDSGIEWLGEIPSGWNSSAVWVQFEIGRGRVISNEEIASNVGIYPVYSSQTFNDGVMGYIDTYDFDGNYITWTTDGANAGTVFTRSGKFNCTNVCGTLKSNKSETNIRFYMYALSMANKWFVRHDINPKLMNNVISAIRVPVCSILEQKQIANFLDHETAKIDTLIEKQQRLIELLTEKRQAVISHAVTKGLNPDVPMKDSGVEWLGEVPEHWEVKSYRHASEIYRGKFGHRPRNDPAFYDGDYPFIQTGDVARANKVITSYSQTLNEKGKSVSQLFPKGTLVMAIAANIGDIAILGFESYAPDSVVGFKPYKDIDLEFLRYSFMGSLPALEQTSTQSTQSNLNVDRIGAVKGVFPPFEEQIQIVSKLDALLELYTLIEKKANQQIQLMQERRTALISAAVTGKIDVRDWVKPE